MGPGTKEQKRTDRYSLGSKRLQLNRGGGATSFLLRIDTRADITGKSRRESRQRQVYKGKAEKVQILSFPVKYLLAESDSRKHQNQSTEPDELFSGLYVSYLSKAYRHADHSDQMAGIPQSGLCPCPND